MTFILNLPFGFQVFVSHRAIFCGTLLRAGCRDETLPHHSQLDFLTVLWQMTEKWFLRGKLQKPVYSFSFFFTELKKLTFYKLGKSVPVSFSFVNMNLKYLLRVLQFIFIIDFNVTNFYRPYQGDMGYIFSSVAMICQPLESFLWRFPF